MVIEVDTQYIKGMINHPDIQLNAAMNCWLAEINTFDFKLCHVPATTHRGLDGYPANEKPQRIIGKKKRTA